MVGRGRRCVGGRVGCVGGQGLLEGEGGLLRFQLVRIVAGIDVWLGSGSGHRVREARGLLGLLGPVRRRGGENVMLLLWRRGRVRLKARGGVQVVFLSPVRVVLRSPVRSRRVDMVVLGPVRRGLRVVSLSPVRRRGLH